MPNIEVASLLFRMFNPRNNIGPAMAVVGCAMLYFVPAFASHNPGPAQYVVLVMLSLVVLVGLILTLRGVPVSTDQSVAGNLPKNSGELELAVTQLAKNYELLRRQCTQGFVLAAVCMLLGVIVILSGSVGHLFGFAKSGSDLASAAGIILEFISGTALLLYCLNFKRLGETSNKLHETWRILTAFRLAESLPEQEKTTATVSLIRALVGGLPSLAGRFPLAQD